MRANGLNLAPYSAHVFLDFFLQVSSLWTALLFGGLPTSCDRIVQS